VTFEQITTFIAFLSPS